MSGSARVEQLPYNHYLQPFLAFLKQERGFADSTIVNRKRSLTPFLLVSTHSAYQEPIQKRPALLLFEGAGQKSQVFVAQDKVGVALASDAGGWVTGQIITVDGGLSIS